MSDNGELKSKARSVSDLASLIADGGTKDNNETESKLICKPEEKSIRIEVFSENDLPMFSSSFVSAQMSLSALLFISFGSCVIEGIISGNKFTAGDVCVYCDEFLSYEGRALMYREMPGVYYFYRCSSEIEYTKLPADRKVTVYSATSLDYNEVLLSKETFDIKASTYYVDTYKR